MYEKERDKLMTINHIINKRVQSIVLMLLIGIIAVGGLLLLMGQLAAPETAPTPSSMESQPVQEPDSPQEPIAETTGPNNNNEEDIVATVNDEIITKEAWQQVTRLDAVMSHLAFQAIPTAEETLDRLVNEIVILADVNDIPRPTAEEIETRVSSLIAAWNITAEALESALVDVGLERIDLTERVGRLIQVEAVLNRLAEQEDDVDAWLIQARASAEIGVYRSLVNPSPAETQAAQPAVAERATNIEATQSVPAVSTAPAPTEIEIFGPPTGMPTAPYPQNAAPDFTLPRLNDTPLTLSDFRGKPTIVNFWATWCPPCRRELPALQTAYAARSDRLGFVAVDVKEDEGRVSSFAEELGLTFPIVFDLDGAISDVSYEVRGLPTTLFVDANGVVAARHIGPLDEATINSYLAPLLQPPVTLAEESAVENEALEPAVTMLGTGDSSSMSTADGHNASGSDQSMTQPQSDWPVAPDFTSISGDGSPVSPQDYRDKSNVVLVFYRGHT